MATDFPPGAGVVPDPLLPDVTGPGFFNLADLGIAINVGETLSFLLLPGFDPGVCDPGTFMCTSGNVGQFCFDDFECEKAFRAGTSGDTYSGGTALVNGAPLPSSDLAFKTFVAP